MTLQRLAERKRLHDWYNRLTNMIDVCRYDGKDTADLESERNWVLNELRTVRT